MKFPQPFAEKYVQLFRSVAEETPVPWFLSSSQEKWIDEAPLEDLKSGAAEFLIAAAKQPVEVTSLTIRVASVHGVDQQEECLGFLPIGMHFSAPLIDPNSSTSQDEIDALWSAMTGPAELRSYVKEGVSALVEEFRKWFSSPSGEFPVSPGGNDREFHSCCTLLTIVHLPKRRRGTYVERPVFIRLRPLSELEQRKVELDYWNAIGDSGRATLVEEIINRIESASAD